MGSIDGMAESWCNIVQQRTGAVGSEEYEWTWSCQAAERPPTNVTTGQPHVW